MFRKLMNWQTAALGLACVMSTGCSTNRMLTQQSSPTSGLPDQKSVSVPGTSEVAKGDELRHPATVFLAYGRWQEQQKQLPQARESFEKALRHDPRSVEALLGLSRLDRLAGRNQEAERHLAQAEKLRPGNALIAAAWGEHYAAVGRWNEAINRYRMAVEQAPDETLYRHQLAVVLTRSGAVQEGLDMFASIIHPAEAHYNVAYLLHSQGKLLEAEAQYQRALALNPQLVVAQNMLTKIRKERGVPETQLAKQTTPTDGPARPQVSVASPSASSTPTTASHNAAWQTHEDRGYNMVQPAAALSAEEEQRRNQQF